MDICDSMRNRFIYTISTPHFTRPIAFSKLYLITSLVWVEKKIRRLGTHTHTHYKDRKTFKHREIANVFQRPVSIILPFNKTLSLYLFLSCNLSTSLCMCYILHLLKCIECVYDFCLLSECKR